MKKIVIILFSLFSFLEVSAQPANELAGVYIKRAWEKYNDILTRREAIEEFNKALEMLDSVNTSDIARLGTFIHFELSQFSEAKKYKSYYFELVKNKKTDEYEEMLMLSADIEDGYKNQLEEQKRIEEERILMEKEARKVDSLKTIWMNKSDLLSIKVDSIYKFNANNVAVFKDKESYGLINDVGETLVEANEYLDVVVFDGFFIFKNKISEPTKLYCYNSKTNTGFLIPNISDFNTLSTNYGNVMLPRGNGRLVTFPNNLREPFVFDLNLRKIVRVDDQEDLLKNLKKTDIIDKYNNDGEVKIDKEWYNFGGHLGGGIHPIYAQKGYKLEGFLCSIDGSFLKTTTYDYVGFFYNNSAQAIKGTQVFWINQNGTKVNPAINEDAVYQGKSKSTKLANGKYQIKRDDLIILGDKKLENLEEFLRNSLGN